MRILPQLKEAAVGSFGLGSTSLREGELTGSRGGLLQAILPGASLGEMCYVESTSAHPSTAQIISFQGDHVELFPVSTSSTPSAGSKVWSFGEPLAIKIPANPLGMVLDAMGKVLHPNGSRIANKVRPIQLHKKPPSFFDRQQIQERNITGVSLLDIFCPIGMGQRISVCAPAAVGKSTLLSMLARNMQYDCCVIALIGERGREVQEFYESLERETLRKVIFVVSTSDETPVHRRLAAFTAMGVAESFAQEGKQVLLLLDSLTRTLRAMREIALLQGELPTHYGYPPSVFSDLPALFERAGKFNQGSITAVFSLLKEERTSDPVAKEIESLLDGHVILSPRWKERGLVPAIDPLASLSRLEEHLSEHEENGIFADRSAIKREQELSTLLDFTKMFSQDLSEKRSHVKSWEQLKLFLNRFAGERY